MNGLMFLQCSFQMIVYGRINQSVQVQWTSHIWTPDTQTKQFTLNDFILELLFLIIVLCDSSRIPRSKSGMSIFTTKHYLILNFALIIYSYMVKRKVSLHYR